MRIFERDRSVRAWSPGVPSDELSKSFVLGSGRRSSRARHHHLSLSHARQSFSYLDHHLFPSGPLRPPILLLFRFIFMYLLLSAFEVAPRDRILSVRLRNSGYVSFCIIHCSVDPEGCWSSNKCCLRVILSPFSPSRVCEFTWPPAS